MKPGFIDKWAGASAEIQDAFNLLVYEYMPNTSNISDIGSYIARALRELALIRDTIYADEYREVYEMAESSPSRRRVFKKLFRRRRSQAVESLPFDRALRLVACGASSRGDESLGAQDRLESLRRQADGGVLKAGLFPLQLLLLRDTISKLSEAATRELQYIEGTFEESHAGQLVSQLAFAIEVLRVERTKAKHELDLGFRLPLTSVEIPLVETKEDIIKQLKRKLDDRGTKFLPSLNQ